jgi:hypothetical protein
VGDLTELRVASKLSGMDKKHALDVFGGSTELARELGIQRQAVSAWPDPLPQKTVDRLIGLAFRRGKILQLVGASKLESRADATPES